MSQITDAVDRVRGTFNDGRTKPKSWRHGQLEALNRMLQNEQQAILDALAADVGKGEFEAYTSEIALVCSDIKVTSKHLDSWMKGEKAGLPLAAVVGSVARVVHEPLGVALIIGAWNYPIMLTLGPLVGAIAGGNAAVIKPSELVPNSAAVIERLVRQYLDPDAFAVVQGGVPETTELLGCRFDKILFTGSPAVGKIVMKAAAVNLTPVVLELGGKSPAIICQDANLEVAATRVTWGKFFNAGQTCIGVDYALVHESVYEEFIDLVRGRIRRFYGDDPHASPDYPRIVNEPNLQRLCSLLEGQSIVVGGQSIAAERYLAPTVLRDVDPQSSIMQEEIFGPILPMLPFTDVDEVIGRVNAGEKPLAMYIFSQDKLTVRRILSAVSSGGACINDVLVHITAAAPFGGVGNSGMGSYHGRDGYDAFTHRRTVVTSGTAFDPSVRYPPYSRFKNKVSKYLV